ncbi:deazaflavin-dependent oxidoreductase (nitroreductase family) [Mycolicibacterium sp. BK556]|uniref:nitroreductase family deazaflavin-dependent oxidoreductase n=1 Tax=unclassified Mycolicibacterium TaxID=2636767 RepID=UPI001615477C|nr:MULTISPECIES: nitroreductase family deazaflavin-dependent oxidoreductase [unclassified Mycolicibacterium]MBB3603295.1 deazaflavin-dependent oxidoreductase (nitroreductase family) [Mycolicibacterium sp. BK556]MBB3633490.1 deazaflavin-dependent oxidoreductase (nitroreductase family) [Mycolicibacterium sp. BK607]
MSTANQALRKFRRERFVGRYVANPTVALLGRLGLRTTFATELQTLGRKSGQWRPVPVSARFDETGAWVISQHGRRSGWALNVADDPNVRIRQGNRWRSGTARFVPDDDPAARAQTFATSAMLTPLVTATFKALQSDPISVRIDFTD